MHAMIATAVGRHRHALRLWRRPASEWAVTQYAAIKATVADHLLVMQVGNFYELYKEDAIAVNARLPLALSKSGMAGFPYHRKDAWIPQLQAIFGSVAVADQCDPGVSPTHSREITRIFTPGTLLPEIDVLEDVPRHLAAITPDNPFDPKRFGLCTYDNVTGQLQFDEKTLTDLLADLPGLDIVELLLVLPDLRDDACRQVSLKGLQPSASVPLSYMLAPLKCLQDAYVMGLPQNWLMKPSKELDLVALPPLQQSAANLVINYLHRCYPKQLPTLLLPQAAQPLTTTLSFGVVNEPAAPLLKPHMVIDADTRESLSLTTPRGKGSLLHAIDRTVTAFGKRELHMRLSNPITDREAIEARLDLVEYFYELPQQVNELQSILRACPDALRCLAKLATSTTVDVIADNLFALMSVSQRISKILKSPLLMPIEDTVGAAQYRACLEDLQSVLKGIPLELYASLKGVEEPHEDFDFPAVGFDPRVETQRQALDLILQRAQAHVDKLGVADLTVTELSDGTLAFSLKPKDANSMKGNLLLVKRGVYTTPELQALSIANGDARRSLAAAQLDSAKAVSQMLIAHSHIFEKASAVLSHLDISAGLARVATYQEYTRPILTNGAEFHVVQGRHAILDALSADDPMKHFRPNDCDLTSHASIVITGPNMGGKSTYLRQNALIAVLAQMGSFVPAQECVVGIVDKLFTRVGAQDNQVEGKSTFLVEMEETANIINNATPRSFVVMDEVGRGTNSIEGLALAVSISRHLAQIGCRCMSVTHHLQLPTLLSDLNGVGLYKFVAERDEQGRILFHHSIQPGIADDAHAIAVATFAGHPPAVTDMARIVLQQLQAQRFGFVDAASVQRAIAQGEAPIALQQTER
eukprot:m.158880 g.158880  ORF g.158880 m.158880 type:complete len:869 (+) comp16341_c1_seq1:97-2703(+)